MGSDSCIGTVQVIAPHHLIHKGLFCICSCVLCRWEDSIFLQRFKPDSYQMSVLLNHPSSCMFFFPWLFFHPILCECLLPLPSCLYYLLRKHKHGSCTKSSDPKHSIFLGQSNHRLCSVPGWEANSLKSWSSISSHFGVPVLKILKVQNTHWLQQVSSECPWWANGKATSTTEHCECTILWLSVRDRILYYNIDRCF